MTVNNRSARGSSSRLFGAGIIGSTFVAQGVAMGFSIGIFPLFMEHLEADFGATRTQTSFGIPLLLMTGALASPWIGRRLDSGSPRAMMIAGAIMMMIGLVLVSRAPSLLIAMLSWAFFVGLGNSMLGTLPSATVLAHWFSARRATMIGIAAMGITITNAIVPPIAVFAIGAFGWRDALMGFGIACVVIVVPIVARWVVKRPEDVGEFPDGVPPDENNVEPAMSEPTHNPIDERSPLRRADFWILGGILGPIAGSGIAFFTHVLMIAAERGIQREEAVFILTAIALATTGGKIVFGILADRLGAKLAFWIAIGCMLGGGGIVYTASTSIIFLIGAILYSLGAGCLVPCQATLVINLFGRDRFGHVMGLLGILIILSVVVLPTFIGVLYDTFGNYNASMVALLAALVFPAFLLGLLKVKPVCEAARQEVLV